jgi:hypothetical protein
MAAGRGNQATDFALLDDKGRKARYGVSYVRNVCAQAGVPFMETEPDSDVHAVDCGVTFPAAEIRVQVKCSSQFKMSGKTATWSIEPDWVRKWERALVPVYFVLVIVPEHWSVWLNHEPTQTVHTTGAFWGRVNDPNHTVGQSLQIKEDEPIYPGHVGRLEQRTARRLRSGGDQWTVRLTSRRVHTPKQSATT